MDINKTKDLDLCVSCGVCAASCPVGAISMQRSRDQYLPVIDPELCTNCGLCAEVCPGLDVDPSGLRHKEVSDELFNGPCIASYTAHSNNRVIRAGSTSGGMITALASALLEAKEFDAAFVLKTDDLSKAPSLTAVETPKDVISGAKSKYIPASVAEVVRTLKEQKGRYIIIGTSCQFQGIKKFLARSGMPSDDLLFLGLFCDKTMNLNLIRYFEDAYAKRAEKLAGIDFRTKEGDGWPGDTKLVFDSGREQIVDKSVRRHLKPFFQLDRCLFCLDKLNREADISFGDCYLKGHTDPQGRSSVIVRTQKGADVLSRHSSEFTLDPEDVNSIRRAQSLASRKKNLEHAKILITDEGLYGDERYDVSPDSRARLAKLRRHISWGKDYKKTRIDLNQRFADARAKFDLGATGALIAASLAKELIFGWARKPKNPGGKNIIITGGSLFNKGAQAMTFTTVDQLKRRFPDKDIYLFSTQDASRPEEEKAKYAFRIMPWDIALKAGVLSGSAPLRDSNQLGKLKKIIEDTSMFVDISGLSLTSHWNPLVSLSYLMNIAIAKRSGTPFYIMPQSMGPFDYSMRFRPFLYPLLQLYLKYPKRIFIREQEGIKAVRRFTRKNVQRSWDLVMQNSGYDMSNIYTVSPSLRKFDIPEGSVGIIPNKRLIERSKTDMFPLYEAIIKRLLAAGKRVYVLRHSYEDLAVCEQIKSMFPADNRVELIEQDLSAIELEEIIKRFDFVIASRYHSLIHAYKNAVPALNIGWAAKYKELAEALGQSEYFADARSELDESDILAMLDKLLARYSRESESLAKKAREIVKANVFDIFNRLAI